MNGAESFVSQNFSEHDSTFYSCLHLIVYGYLQLEKSKTYSRKEIQSIATSVRGKEAKIVELEDFLRNDLVTNYIEPNRPLFGLKYYQFNSGVEEFSNNIKTGILDIKVSSPLLNGNTYFIFECKRLNKTIIDNYIKEGVSRFVMGQYYPNNQNPIAGMISFLESIDIKNRIDCISAFSSIEKVLLKYKDEINLNGSFLQYKLECNNFKDIEDYKYTFVSMHTRSTNTLPIDIFHLVLDYNHLIVD